MSAVSRIITRCCCSAALLFGAAACAVTGGGVNTIPSRWNIEKSLVDIETAKLPEIERLIDLCGENGIAVDYERVDYTVVKNFIAYVRDDMAHGDMARAAYGLNCLNDLCDALPGSLNDYLAGLKQAREVPRYVTGPLAIQGSSLMGRTIYQTTGQESTRPIFFVGYGHFDQIVQDIPQMAGYGVNILETEIGPRDTVIVGAEGGYDINPAGIEKLEHILREAEKHNVKVDVLLSPHYFPEWVFRKYPYLRENTGGFFTYAIYEPEAKKVLQTHMSGVMERIKDYQSLHSVCLSNEPVFSTARNFNVRNRDSTVNRMWQRYLADAHGDIAALNAVYKTDYRGFDRVPMPRRSEATPQFFDWMTFNDMVFGDWHQWLAELVHAAAPHVPVHAKIMDASLSPTGGRPSLEWGINAERFTEFSQLNGNDSYNLYNGSATITAKMKWYDYLMSLKKRPIYNSEDHIIADRARDYVPQQVMHVRSDLWQGAVHGRTATTIWVWERTHHKNSDFAGSILHRPDVVSAAGKISLDLNRLAHEVTALQNEPAYAAILYSNPARIYDAAYLDMVSAAYTGIIYSGIKAGFITEKQLAGGEWGSYRVIIIPAAAHIMDGTLGALRQFMESGGKVIVAGTESLSRDYYDRDITGADRTFIMANAQIPNGEIGDAIREAALESGLCRVTLRDHNTGAWAYGVEWLSAEYNGKLLINVCNYEWGKSKSISVFINDKPAGSMTDLISGAIINAENMELAPYTPILLSVDL